MQTVHRVTDTTLELEFYEETGLSITLQRWEKTKSFVSLAVIAVFVADCCQREHPVRGGAR